MAMQVETNINPLRHTRIDAHHKVKVCAHCHQARHHEVLPYIKPTTPSPPSPSRNAPTAPYPAPATSIPRSLATAP
ncbi:hypothetical protein ACET3X_001929 [Alternaria dauci]|uniref:Doubled CXXCH motif domain-containing protein n=1 Tax=Alternaria dauci TaxID=48095 RepID=A0ABR3UZ30_9PLEO